MKISAAIVVAALLTGLVLLPRSSVHSSAKSQQPARKLYAPGEILVQMRNVPSVSTPPEDVAGQILPHGAIRARSLPIGGPSGLYQIKVSSDLSVEQAVAQASQDPRVEFAEPNYYYYPSQVIPNDTFFNQEWDLLNTGMASFGGKAGADIEATKAWDITTGSSDVVVAITDSGVDLNHPDLAANAWVNPGEIPGNGIDDDHDGFVDDVNGWNFFGNNGQIFDPATELGHGTHVTGTIGAVGDNGIGVAGVAWHVKLMVLKFIGQQPDGTYSGSTADAVSAINYAIMQKKRGINLCAINASWDGPKASQSLRKAIIKAGKVGITFVCAAGNADVGSGQNMDDASQAQYPGAWNDISTLISVAATDYSDQMAYFSNYGHASVTVAAPGVRIWSTYLGSSYTTLDGTSMASPHVAGVVALLASTEPTLTPAQVKQRIINTSVPLVSLASKVQCSGRVDAYNALTNQVAPAGDPQITNVTTDKKFVTVTGINFANSSAVVYVNGAPLPKMQYDTTYGLANGTLTQLRSKVGKANIGTTFPTGQTVSVTVVNTSSGATSSPYFYTR